MAPLSSDPWPRATPSQIYCRLPATAGRDPLLLSPLSAGLWDKSSMAMPSMVSGCWDFTLRSLEGTATGKAVAGSASPVGLPGPFLGPSSSTQH